MNLVTGALRRPITIIVIVLSMLIFAIVAIVSIPIDIFPKLNLPTIYVIESYGGMSPQQMEGFFATGMQDQFLYINGVKSIESKNIQGLTLLKLTFYESTDMAEASAQVALQVGRVLKLFPPGALPPQVIRFDASSLPVGELVFSSPDKSLKDINDLAATRIRPMFASIPGLSAPPPFGANARSVIVDLDPDKLRSYDLSPDEVVAAIAKTNVMAPSGNLRQGNLMYITTSNSLEKTVSDFAQVPLKTTPDGATVFISDVARVEDGADITVDYALVNGKRSVYIPVVKTADASTWSVVQQLKQKLPEMQSLLPDDVHIEYAFDQSVFVINSVKSLVTEGALGALLTGLMVLLFLRDWRSSVIVIVTIPVSVLTGVLFLKLAGQTINMMTLSGLALAVGILVDQATVTIENIHQHLEMGKPKAEAIYDACKEISFPLLLILLCILAVFAPAFMMSGVPKAMFLPLSLSIGFAMIASYFLAQSLVPILCNWMLKAEKFQHGRSHAGEALDTAEHSQITQHLEEEIAHPSEDNFFERLKLRFMRTLERMMKVRRLIIGVYFVGVLGLAALCFSLIGEDLMPRTNAGQFQMRIKEPDGTRLEKTEVALREVLGIIDSTVDHHVSISSAYVGLVPSSYGSSNLYVFNSGTHEAVLQINMDKDYHVNMDDLKDALRKNIAYRLPELRISFEPIDLTDKIMSEGANTPIEVQVAGKDMGQIIGFADSLLGRIRQIPYLRDVQIEQPLHMPAINIDVDRFKAAQFGLTVDEVSRSLTASTSSSRFSEKNLWLDTRTAYTYQVQVQMPEYVMTTIDELKEVPLVKGQSRPVLGDVADVTSTSIPGEYDRRGPRRFITIGANLYKKDLGTATRDVQKIVDEAGQPPKGTVVSLRGESNLLNETLGSLQQGLLFAVVVILLLLSANYESFKLGLTVLVTVPAVILGSLVFLLARGATLNLQSYMGMIMSIGVSVANAILVVSNAESLRLEYNDAGKAAIRGAGIRLRPILMTSLAMIVGMIPMASGMGESGEQTAPLGVAVIGGLIASTLSALFILPLVFAGAQRKASLEPPSLLPKPKFSKITPSMDKLGFLIAIVSVLALSSCGGSDKPKDLTGGAPISASATATAQPDSIVSVSRRSISHSLSLPGEFRPFEFVDIYPKVNGFVTNVLVDRGSKVHKGEVLMTLEAPEMDQQILAAQDLLAKADQVFATSKDRYQRLLQTSRTPGAVSPFDLQSAQGEMRADSSAFNAQRSTIGALQVMKSYLTVRAPFDGVISERNVHPGALVGPSSSQINNKPMLALEQEDHLRLVVYVPESVSDFINRDGTATFILNAAPDKKYSAPIARRAGAINTTVRSEALEIDVNSTDGAIKPGMFAEVKLPLSTASDSYVVPTSAILSSTMGQFLADASDPTHPRLIPIQKGMDERDSTVVFGDLKGTTRVLNHPPDALLGTLVK
jgi:RND family efflux transporter MFP subunit